MGALKKMYDWLHPKPVEPPTTTAETGILAEKALAKATADLQSAQEKRPEVTILVSKIEDQLARNHFGEMLEASMRGRA
ncbi:hypothetical protein SEA_MAGRITTE_42 [Microbacterium phage Magritte]|nr:hypothetical protein SEA_MAGRITTE_42 [Microbacterium phage Magritte]